MGELTNSQKIECLNENIKFTENYIAEHETGDMDEAQKFDIENAKRALKMYADEISRLRAAEESL